MSGGDTLRYTLMFRIFMLSQRNPFRINEVRLTVYAWTLWKMDEGLMCVSAQAHMRARARNIVSFFWAFR
jgi:hypothetical protein